MRNVCKRFIVIENPEQKSETSKHTGGSAKATAALPLPFAAISKIVQEGIWYNLQQVGLTGQTANPDFDTRSNWRQGSSRQ